MGELGPLRGGHASLKEKHERSSQTDVGQGQSLADKKRPHGQAVVDRLEDSFEPVQVFVRVTAGLYQADSFECQVVGGGQDFALGQVHPLEDQGSVVVVNAPAEDVGGKIECGCIALFQL